MSCKDSHFFHIIKKIVRLFEQNNDNALNKYGERHDGGGTHGS